MGENGRKGAKMGGNGEKTGQTREKMAKMAGFGRFLGQSRRIGRAVGSDGSNIPGSRVSSLSAAQAASGEKSPKLRAQRARQQKNHFFYAVAGPRRGRLGDPFLPLGKVKVGRNSVYLGRKWRFGEGGAGALPQSEQPHGPPRTKHGPTRTLRNFYAPLMRWEKGPKTGQNRKKGGNGRKTGQTRAKTAKTVKNGAKNAF